MDINSVSRAGRAIPPRGVATDATGSDPAEYACGTISPSSASPRLVPIAFNACECEEGFLALDKQFATRLSRSRCSTQYRNEFLSMHCMERSVACDFDILTNFSPCIAWRDRPAWPKQYAHPHCRPLHDHLAALYAITIRINRALTNHPSIHSLQHYTLL